MTALRTRKTAKLLFAVVPFFLLSLFTAAPARADQLIADDLIVQGSSCVGLDCANGESFGFETIRIKENNLRIRAFDTSNSASFPTVDWQIVFNESSNGGQNKFSIEDIDAGRLPFTIEHNAPSNSLYVDDGGRIGLGTSTPVVEVHIKDGDTPTLRLEQDGSSGFTPQTWDVAGNETNFFVRDATNGSRLPFKIFPNAPTNSLTVEGSTGDIGMGTANPAASLHLLRGGATDTAQLRIEDTGGSGAETLLHLRNNGPGRWEFRDTVNTVEWDMRTTSGGTFAITQPSSPSNDLQINSNGSVVIRGDVTANGVMLTSSRSLKHDIRDVEADEALAALDGLVPVQYAYKTTPGVRHVGFIAEDVPDLVASKNRKTLATMNVVAVVTKVVKEQNRTIEEQRMAIEELQRRLKTLEVGANAQD